MSSYCTMAEAAEYMSTRFGADAWYSAAKLPFPVISEIIFTSGSTGTKYSITVVTDEYGTGSIVTTIYTGTSANTEFGTWLLEDVNSKLYEVTYYLDEDEAQQFYISQRSVVSPQYQALVTATAAIDRLNFIGTILVEGQTNQFPRTGATEVPDNIKIACMEEALSLLEGRDPNMEFENLRMLTQTYANVKSAFDPGIVAEHIISGITSSIAWRYIRPYLRDLNSTRFNRV